MVGVLVADVRDGLFAEFAVGVRGSCGSTTTLVPTLTRL
jgi:hypothetical protein